MTPRRGGGSRVVGEPDVSLPRCAGRNSSRCSRDPARGAARLLWAAAAACAGVIIGLSLSTGGSELPRAVSPCTVGSRASSRGVLFGVCGGVECCRTCRVVGCSCAPLAIGCTVGGCNGGRDVERGGGAFA